MGTTLAHPDIGPFTHAIVHTDNKKQMKDQDKKDREEDEIYQLIGRCCGRLKDPDRWGDWMDAPPTKIFWSEYTRKMALSAEGGTSACNDAHDGETVTLQTFQIGHERAKREAERTAQPRKTKEEEAAERKAAREAKKAMERQQKAEQKQREKEQKRADREAAKAKDNINVSQVSFEDEIDRLINKAFPKWSSNLKQYKIGRFLKEVDQNKVYSAKEFRDLRAKYDYTYIAHFLSIKVAKSKGYGPLFICENNTYKLHDHLKDAHTKYFA
tara:strand:- start:358 stop:1167 length:810 start_codon:yes stop_codon:yes gene_type:complete